MILSSYSSRWRTICCWRLVRRLRRALAEGSARGTGGGTLGAQDDCSGSWTSTEDHRVWHPAWDDRGELAVWCVGDGIRSWRLSIRLASESRSGSCFFSWSEIWSYVTNPNPISQDDQVLFSSLTSSSITPWICSGPQAWNICSCKGSLRLVSMSDASCRSAVMASGRLSYRDKALLWSSLWDGLGVWLRLALSSCPQLPPCSPPLSPPPALFMPGPISAPRSCPARPPLQLQYLWSGQAPGPLSPTTSVGTSATAGARPSRGLQGPGSLVTARHTTPLFNSFSLAHPRWTKSGHLSYKGSMEQELAVVGVSVGRQCNSMIQPSTGMCWQP